MVTALQFASYTYGCFTLNCSKKPHVSRKKTKTKQSDTATEKSPENQHYAHSLELTRYIKKISDDNADALQNFFIARPHEWINRPVIPAQNTNVYTTPLCAGINRHLPAIVDALIKAKADVNSPKASPPIIHACSMRAMHGISSILVQKYYARKKLLVTSLIAAHADVNARDRPSQRTALFAICDTSYDVSDIVELLLDAKADTHAVRNGKTPLAVARENNNEPVVKLLSDHKNGNASLAAENSMPAAVRDQSKQSEDSPRSQSIKRANTDSMSHEEELGTTRAPTPQGPEAIALTFAQPALTQITEGNERTS